MIKRREPRALSEPQRTPTEEEIEAFAAAADGAQCEIKEPQLNPRAKRDYKAIRVPFNEYEFEKLEELARKTGRTKLNAIRWAILQMCESQE